MAVPKKFIILGVAGILLVAAVVGVAVGVTRKNNSKKDSPKANTAIKSNSKAVESVCESTDHKDLCVETLNSEAGDVTDPKKLVQMAFDIAMKQIGDSEKNFTGLLNDVTKDPKVSSAFDQCNELLALARRDLDRSAEKLGTLDITQIGEILETIKIWLSASLTYEHTCIDGFADTTGDASDRMKNLLQKAMDLTENTLGMVTQVAGALSGHSFNRRLLSTTDGLPTWAGPTTRRLLAANKKDIKPDIVVAKDGSGKFKTINAAINSIPTDNKKTPFVIYIKEGVYVEKVVIPKDKTNLLFIGDGPRKTKVTGSLSVADKDMTTYHSATFAVMADNFMARDMGFENTAGPEKHQAVAVRVTADFAVFQNCRFDGYQDTLYTHNYRQYYRDCTVTGTIDFIFGDAAVVFQNCNLLIRKGLPNTFNAVTAQGRLNPKMPTGTVIQNCTIKADPENPPLATVKSFLGRPWKNYSRTIIMESDIGGLIDPKGFEPWSGLAFLDTLFYAEYNNRGDGFNKTNRVKWIGIKKIKKEVAEKITAANFIQAAKWIPATGVPYTPGFFLPTPKDEDGAIGLDQAGEFKKDYVKADFKEQKKKN